MLIHIHTSALEAIMIMEVKTKAGGMMSTISLPARTISQLNTITSKLSFQTTTFTSALTVLNIHRISAFVHPAANGTIFPLRCMRV